MTNMPESEVDLFLTSIPQKEPRREAEREAVSELICQVFGENSGFTHNDDGAPCVPGASLSVSHSRNHAILAVHRKCRGIGVDVEEVRTQLEKVKRKFLTEKELDVFVSPVELLCAWTAKEAVYKATLGKCGPSLLDITLHEEGYAKAAGRIYDINYLPLSEREIIAIAVERAS